MKKNVLIGLVAYLLLIPSVAFASTTVFERTEDDLQISSDIEVNEGNLDNILATPKVNEKEKIYDFADLFTDEEEVKLFESVSTYINEYSLDMVIVTINDNNKINAKEYAEDFYDYNYFGFNSTFDGIIYLIDMDNREVYISTTGKGQLIFDDTRINNMLDKSFEYLSIGNYYSATVEFVNDSSTYTLSGIPESNIGYEIDDHGEIIKSKSINWAVTIIGSLLVPSIILYIFISKHKGIKLATTAGDYLDRNDIKPVIVNDVFFTTHTSRVAVVKSDFDGGSSGGGSSTSHGSSGRSHGGGGRHF